jgi:HSP20 family protein
MSRNWDSMREMIALQNRLNHLFDEAGGERGAAPRAGRQEEGRDEDVFERVDWRPAADIEEREGEYVIALDVPGIKREALAIDLDENKLSVHGEREIGDGATGGGGVAGHRRERPAGRFLRRFSLPASIDQSAIAADYKDGVLSIRLPKRIEEKSRKISINVG